MSNKIASLYAEIGADTTKLKKGLADTKGGLKDAAKSFHGFKLDTLAVFGAVTGAVVAAKKAFEFGKEGAQLEFVRSKFDKLAVTVGTTGDSMLADLRKVTRGMVADSQLIASAGDFMSLGLAKTSDQVVRLTRVAGALNMDMNQLVLTLANKTTMRFDQLGVAVDGFDERLNNLKATGMDVNAAFTEAFLQQAEAQVKKVGEVADSGAGAFNELNTSVANLVDTLKKDLAPAAITVARSLNKALTVTETITEMDEAHAKSVLDVTDNYRDYIKQLAQFGVLTGKLSQYQADQIVRLTETGDAVGRNKAIYDEFIVTIGALGEAEWEAARASAALDHQDAVTAERMKGLAKETGEAGEAAEKSWGQFYALSSAIRRGGEAAVEAKPEIKSLLGEIDRDIDSPIAAFIADLQWYRSGGRTFEKAFDDIKNALDEGVITPSEADTYMKELYIAVTDFQEEIGQIDATEAATNISETVGGSVQEAKSWIDGTDSIMSALTALTSKEWYLNITYKVKGAPPGLPVGSTPGEPVEPGLVPGHPGGAHGLSGIVPPGFPGDSYLVGATSGEHVEITPQGQGGKGDVYVVQNFYDQGAAALGMAYVETLRGQRLDASMGR